MEEETKRTLVRHLKECVGLDSVDLPTDIMSITVPKKKLQEWNSILFSNGVLYLLDAKHDMSQ